MNRYLLNFSYIGTNFRGLQRQIVKSEDAITDKSTVQGCIELALKNIKPLNEPVLVLSSRTDKGVHSLSNYAHVDLEKSDGQYFQSEKITTTLNKVFAINDIPIRIIQTIHVPDNFHSRYNAKFRTYLYRIAIRKENSKNIQEEIIKDLHHFAYIPIEDTLKCLYLHKKVDIEALIETSKLFRGRHDFRTFMTASKNNEKQNRPMYALRTITNISINRSLPPINSYEYEKAIKYYEYWDINISGKSFVYKQVRRIVGSLIALASGRISTKDVYEMLTIPSKYSWHSKAVVAPPHALYLCDVHYDYEDIQLNSNKTKEIIEEKLIQKQNESIRTNIKEEKRIECN